MIVKDNNNPTPSDKFEKAGYDAERKVAYYLRMAFGESSDLLILNDLRVESDDITAQMDHLVIHQHGIVIIESKSVAGKLQVQDDGQWIRWYSQGSGKDKSIGMPNPIKQAKLQGQTLMRVLSKAINEDAREALKALPVDVLVAFSNHNGGIFIAKDKTLYPEVCPADAIDERLSEILERTSKNALTFSLSETNRAKLADFLIKSHKPFRTDAAIIDKAYPKPEAIKPLKAEQKVSEYAPTVKPKPTSFLGVIADAITEAMTAPKSQFKHVCRKCQSDKLEVRFGKNYYLKCLSCDENNRIDVSCPKCKSLLKIRKDKNKFFAECKKCNTSELFHNNG